AGAGIISSILGTFLVRTSEGGDPQKALNTGTFTAAGIMIAVSAGLVYFLLPDRFAEPGAAIGYSKWGIFVAMVGGLVAGVLIGVVTEHYCAKNKGPV